MFRRLRASWMLTKACVNVLQKDKELMLFPILCGLLTVLSTIGFIVPAVALLRTAHSDQMLNLEFGVLGIGYYFVTYSIVLFFNVALLSCAKIRFQGGDPTVKDGFQAAMQNLGVIFSWAAVGGLVSLIMRQLEENLGIFGAILAKFLGGAFSIVSYFAIPVMIFEKKGPVEAFKRSGEIIKKTWGEALGAYLGFGIISNIAAFLIFSSLLGSVVASVSFNTIVPLEIGGVVMVLSFLAAAILSSCLSQIFQAALYIYATTGECPADLGQDLVDLAFQAKKGRKWVLVGQH